MLSDSSDSEEDEKKGKTEQLDFKIDVNTKFSEVTEALQEISVWKESSELDRAIAFDDFMQKMSNRYEAR